MEHHLSIPRDISVVGYGDPPWFRFLAGGITTIRLPVRDFALHTTMQLFNLIHKRRRADSSRDFDVLEPVIINRNSTRRRG